MGASFIGTSRDSLFRPVIRLVSSCKIKCLEVKMLYFLSFPGTGKKGESIWGGKFEDEFKESLKHNDRGIVSMAVRISQIIYLSN